jgi:predicted O-methyltransferase YrrM
MKSELRARCRRWLGMEALTYLSSAVIELNDYGELKKVFGWQNDPILDDPTLHHFDYPEDANNRRVRDAESLGTVVCNINPTICLEIGTSTGHGTALISANAPRARVFTVNIPPEGIERGEGGVLTTIALEHDKIGNYYRERGLTNITQILANTATWEPDIGTIDVAFVDGCHDANFVFNDTRKILKHMKSGSFVLWHDFNFALADKYPWIKTVCQGVERLNKAGLLSGRIYQVRDSWVGVYRVP